MASVVVSVLKKRRRNRGLDDPFDEGQSGSDRSRTARFLLRHSSYFAKSSRKLDPGDAAAGIIQRQWRGYLTRQYLRSLVIESELSWVSVAEALEILARWHIGWSRFLLQLFVAGLYIVIIYYQIFYEQPNGFLSNDSIIGRLVDPSARPLPPVNRPDSFLTFLKDIVNEFYKAQLVDSPYCQEQLAQFCLQNSNQNDSQFESILADNCTVLGSLKTQMAYVDSVNQLLGASFVSQTRRETQRCSTKFLQVDDNLLAASSRSARACLNDIVEATIFSSDSCPENRTLQGELETSSPSCDAIYSKTQEEFIYRPADGLFIFPLHVGVGFSLPVQAVQCKIDRMDRLDWVDPRTKKVCVHLGFLNKFQNGRLISYRECFDFTIGGSVQRRRVVASISLFSDPLIPLALTWAAIVIILVRLVLDLVLFLNERRAGTSVRYNRAVLSSESVSGIIPSLLILTQCILFLVLVYSIQQTEADARNASTSNATRTLLYLDVMINANWAIQLWVVFTSVVAVSLLIMLGRTIALLGFHPTSAIISGTLQKASSNLGCFFLIFSLVVLIYALVGVVLLGRSRVEFSSFGSAINHLLFFTVGEVEQAYRMIFATNVDEEYVVVIQALYFWSYILLCTILLMNLLLSIIVGAFVELQEKAEKKIDGKPIITFSRSFYSSLAFLAEGLLVHVTNSCPQCKCARCRPFCFSSSCLKARTRCRRCCGPLLSQKEKAAIEAENIIRAAKARAQADAEGGDWQRDLRDEKMEAAHLLLSPWERLVAFNRHRPSSGFIQTRKLRENLLLVFRSEATVQHIISWCRARTRAERMEKFKVHLQGMDPDSALLKGHTAYMLDAILRKLSTGGSFERATNASTRSVRSVASDVSVTESRTRAANKAIEATVSSATLSGKGGFQRLAANTANKATVSSAMPVGKDMEEDAHVAPDLQEAKIADVSSDLRDRASSSSSSAEPTLL